MLVINRDNFPEGEKEMFTDNEKIKVRDAGIGEGMENKREVAGMRRLESANAFSNVYVRLLHTTSSLFSLLVDTDTRFNAASIQTQHDQTPTSSPSIQERWEQRCSENVNLPR